MFLVVHAIDGNALLGRSRFSDWGSDIYGVFFVAAFILAFPGWRLAMAGEGRWRAGFLFQLAVGHSFEWLYA